MKGWISIERTVETVGDLRKLVADLDALRADDSQTVGCDLGAVWATVAASSDDSGLLAATDARGLTLTRDSDIPAYDWPTRDRLQGSER